MMRMQRIRVKIVGNQGGNDENAGNQGRNAGNQDGNDGNEGNQGGNAGK